MKLTEMRELTQGELNTQIESANKALFEARFKHTLHQLDSTAELSQLKHRISQLKTVLNEKGQK